MAVGLLAPEKLLPVAGVKIATVAAKFKANDREDFALFEIDAGATVAGVFTTNAFQAAPVTVAKQHLAKSTPRYFLVNSGNANAGTGHAGMALVNDICGAVAARAGVDASEVLVFSTGVIGQLPKFSCYENGITQALPDLHVDRWRQAASAIMTTDTVMKGESIQCVLGGQTITVTGIAKGSGMIRPNMATMLAYIATDAIIPQSLLDQWLSRLVDKSFNRVTVDGDMSTNDACMLVATGHSKINVEDVSSAEADSLFDSLQRVFNTLAQSLVRDGEGATKFVTIKVQEASNSDEALAVAYQVAHSPLVKTALFASDPNWGRILAAVGNAGVTDLDVSAVRIYIDDILLCANGGVAPDYTEQLGQLVFDKAEFSIRICLDRGDVAETVWTSDLSYDYVKINAEYRT